MFDSRQGQEFFLLLIASRRTVVFIQPPVQCAIGNLSLEVKRPDREGDHSLSCNIDVKNTWSYTSTPYASTWLPLAPQPSLGLGLLRNLLPLKMAEFLGGFSTIVLFTG
jgi:hypothetical protein